MTGKDLFERDISPPHPGEILREDVLPCYLIDRQELARHLKIDAFVIDDLLTEVRDIDLDLAMRLGAAFGQGAHFWLGLQMQHDLWQSRNRDIKVRPIHRSQWIGNRPPTQTCPRREVSTAH